MKRKKLIKTDGLGPYEIKQIRSAIRLVWSRSYARNIAIKRSTLPSGFFCCEICGILTPKIKIDHIEAVGDLNYDFISRLFCPSISLQGLCSGCHNEKTKLERKLKKVKP